MNKEGCLITPHVILVPVFHERQRTNHGKRGSYHETDFICL